jgi:hypothetical protein
VSTLLDPAVDLPLPVVVDLTLHLLVATQTLRGRRREMSLRQSLEVVAAESSLLVRARPRRPPQTTPGLPTVLPQVRL